MFYAKGIKDHTDLASRITAYRAKHDLSLREFAELCNLSYQTICNIENGKAHGTKLTQAKILNIIERGKN